MFRALGDMLRALGFRSLGYESWKYLHLQSETVCVCVQPVRLGSKEPSHQRSNQVVRSDIHGVVQEVLRQRHQQQ